MAKTKWLVDVFEYERGWGSRLDETRKFTTYEKAKAFVRKFNAQNNEPTVPDWYMVAREPRPQE